MYAEDQGPAISGTPGIVTPLQSLKASRSKVPVQGIPVPYANSSLAYQCAAIIGFGQDIFTDMLEVSFTLSNQAFAAKFDLKYSRNGAQTADENGAVTEPWQITCTAFEAPADPGLSVTLNVLRQYTGTECLALYVRFDGISSGNLALSLDTTPTLFLGSPEQMIAGSDLPANAGTGGDTGNFFYAVIGNAQNIQSNYVTGTSQDIQFLGVGSYTATGLNDLTLPGYSKYKPVIIPDSVDLNIYSFPGNYAFYDLTNIGTISSLPAGAAQAFNLEVSPLAGITGIPETRQVIQRLETFNVDATPLTHSMVWERVSTSGAGALDWSAWEQVGKAVHTHVPSDILTNSSAMFVTQAEIDAWNDLIDASSPWTDTVATFADLAGPEGTTTYVVATGFIYTKVGGVWTAMSANSIPVADGTLTGLLDPEDYAKFSRVPMSRQIGTTNSWVFQTNEDLWYDALFANLPADAIDLVCRTEPVPDAIGEKSIGLGFDDSFVSGAGGISIGNGNTVAGANAIALGNAITTEFDENVAIGSNLTVDAVNAVVLGQWNASMAAQGLGFAVGNGTDSGALSNLFGVTNDGVMILGGGYSVSGKGANDLLTADGGSTSLTALESAVVAEIRLGLKTYIYLKPGFATYVIDWSLYSAQYGPFANIQANSLTDKNTYSVETLPISMKTMWLNPLLPDPTLPYVDLSNSTFAISGSNWDINIQALLVSTETTGYQLQYMDELGSVWVNLATIGLTGASGGQSVPAADVPNGMQIRLQALSAGTTSPIYHIFNDSGTLEVFDVDFSEDPTNPKWGAKALQAKNYTIELSSLESLIIIS
jgi:hypothetical protein